MVSSAQGPLGFIFYISFLGTLGEGELETIWGGGRIWNCVLKGGRRDAYRGHICLHRS